MLLHDVSDVLSQTEYVILNLLLNTDYNTFLCFLCYFDHVIQDLIGKLDRVYSFTILQIYDFSIHVTLLY